MKAPSIGWRFFASRASVVRPLGLTYSRSHPPESRCGEKGHAAVPDARPRTQFLFDLDGDPTRNIADIRKVAILIKGDAVYYPSEVYREIGIQPIVNRVTFAQFAKK